MASELFFSVKSIGLSKRSGRKPSTIAMAARHNMRASQNERGARAHIDPALSHLNEHIQGPDTPEAVAALAQALMAGAGVAVDKLRKDYTQAIELLFSLPADTTIDTGRYFAACVDWVRARFGADNILSADIHRDEAMPHCHVLLLPLVGGRMAGAALVARAELAAMRDDFHSKVGKLYGLKKAARMDGATRGALVAAVLERLNATSDPMMHSPAWMAIRKAIERNPEPFAQALGVEVAAPARRLRTVAAIFTGKGRKTAEDQNLGFEPHKQNLGFKAKKDRKLSCVGFAQSAAPIATPEPEHGQAVELVEELTRDDDAGPARCHQAAPPDRRPPPPAAAPARPRPVPPRPPEPHNDDDHHQTVTRVRDADMAVGHWCEELGEWVAAPSKGVGAARAAADAWVSAALVSSRNDGTYDGTFQQQKRRT